MRDGTWAFTLIFGLSPCPLLTTPCLTPALDPVTLCVNAGFYIGEGNSPISAIAFPWLLSVESFAGARIVLNLHTVTLDVSTDGLGTTLGGTLSSHIVFTTNPSAADRPQTPSVQWDWGGVQQSPHDGRSGHAAGGHSDSTGLGTVSEIYEMTSRATAGGTSTRIANPTSPNTCSDTCAEAAEQGVI